MDRQKVRSIDFRLVIFLFDLGLIISFNGDSATLLHRRKTSYGTSFTANQWVTSCLILLGMVTGLWYVPLKSWWRRTSSIQIYFFIFHLQILVNLLDATWVEWSGTWHIHGLHRPQRSLLGFIQLTCPSCCLLLDSHGHSPFPGYAHHGIVGEHHGLFFFIDGACVGWSARYIVTHHCVE